MTVWEDRPMSEPVVIVPGFFWRWTIVYPLIAFEKSVVVHLFSHDNSICECETAHILHNSKTHNTMSAGVHHVGGVVTSFQT